MKLVKEHINEFEQGRDPYDAMGVGSESLAYKNQVYNDLLILGVTYHLYYANTTPDEIKNKILDNINLIKKDVDVLLEIGVDPTHIRVYPTITLKITGYRVYDNFYHRYFLTDVDAKIYAYINDVLQKNQEYINNNCAIEETDSFLDGSSYKVGNLPDFSELLALRKKLANVI
jgi:hypothetical protein